MHFSVEHSYKFLKVWLPPQTHTNSAWKKKKMISIKDMVTFTEEIFNGNFNFWAL